jgi:hypothetical protein
MTARLVERGVPLSAESVFALAGCKSPGRPHVARALVRAGAKEGETVRIGRLEFDYEEDT